MRVLLVGGSGRSGTSFLYKCILSCDRICGVPDFESGLFTSNMSMLDLFDRYDNSYSPERFQYACTVYRSEFAGKFGSDALKHYDDFIKNLYAGRFYNSPYQVTFSSAFESFLKEIFAFDSSKHDFFIEKTPHNVLYANALRRLIPNVQIVHIVRDPRAVAESVLRQNWGPKTFEDCVIWVRLILESWLRKYGAEPIGLGSYIDVIRVEDLVKYDALFANRLRSFANYDFKNLSLKANPATLDRWRDSLSESQITFANEKLAKVMEAFGYKTDVFGSEEQASHSLDMSSMFLKYLAS